MQGLTTGRVVHYTDADGNEHRAAMIVHVHEDDEDGAIVNLFVPETGMLTRVAGVVVRTRFSKTPIAGHWHWVEPA